jgi:hypothetical protein
MHACRVTFSNSAPPTGGQVQLYIYIYFQDKFRYGMPLGLGLDGEKWSGVYVVTVVVYYQSKQSQDTIEDELLLYRKGMYVHVLTVAS